MEFSSAIAFRHSIRYFSARPVPDPVLQAIAEDATRAPSQLNGQDWKIWISTGESLDAIRSEFDERNRAGIPPSTDFANLPLSERSPEVRARMEAIAAEREALGLEADKRASQAVLFHAPAVAFITIPKVHSEWMVLDAGALEAFPLLAAASRGVGSIPAFNLVRYPDIVKRVLGIPDNLILAIGIGLGYPADSPLNRLRTGRAPLSEILTLKH